VGAHGSWGGAFLHLPGEANRRWVSYSVVNGQAFREGDIALGPANTLMLRYGMPRFDLNANANQKNAIPARHRVLWPNGEIPYEIGAGVGQKDKGDISWAVEQLSTTALRLRPRTAADKDYIVFTNDGSGCYSYLGRIGGAQEVHIGNCGKGGPLHEVLHAGGFEHEHTRPDRDSHITVLFQNVASECKNLFDTSDATPSTAYDTESIMHYASYACSRGGEPTMLRKRDGRPIPDADALSALDRSGIQQLYAGNGVPNPNPIPPSIPTPSTFPSLIPGLELPVPTWTPEQLPPGLLPPGLTLPGWS
jgi:hypothetical protein